ncbi:MAG: hypothetical protein WBW31_02530 [Candidatus Sulfotelmatobacter sp.]
MNYTKPEVAALGPAVRVIEERNAKKNQISTDTLFGVGTLNPAYDLDE